MFTSGMRLTQARITVRLPVSFRSWLLFDCQRLWSLLIIVETRTAHAVSNARFGKWRSWRAIAASAYLFLSCCLWRGVRNYKVLFFSGEPSRFPAHPDYVPSIFKHKKASHASAVSRFQRSQKRQTNVMFIMDLVTAAGCHVRDIKPVVHSQLCTLAK